MINKLKNIESFDDLVLDPDHPYAYFNANAIARIGNKLLCLFYPSKEELRTPNKILYRLLNSRIVYPANSTMILILSDSFELNLGYELDKFYFDLVISLNDIKYFNGSLMRESRSSKEINEIKEIQKQTFNFQAINYLNNISFIERTKWKNKEIYLTDESLSKPKYIDSLFQQAYRPRSDIFKGKETFVGFKNLTSQRSNLYELKPFIHFSMRMNYTFDNGIPYHHGLRQKVISLNSIPKSSFDINKPIRILSLFGWLISNTSNIDQINSRIQQSSK